VAGHSLSTETKKRRREFPPPRSMIVKPRFMRPRRLPCRRRWSAHLHESRNAGLFPWPPSKSIPLPRKRCHPASPFPRPPAKSRCP